MSDPALEAELGRVSEVVAARLGLHFPKARSRNWTNRQATV
jgi:hypothetical protein